MPKARVRPVWYPHLPTSSRLRWGAPDLRRARLATGDGLELGDRVATAFFYGDDPGLTLWHLMEEERLVADLRERFARLPANVKRDLEDELHYFLTTLRT